MRKLTVLLVLALSGWLIWDACAQEPVGGIVYSRYRQFRIPFNTGGGEARLRQLQLFVSTDQGRSWQASASAPPDQKHFKYICEREGLFWFAVQTMDVEGKLYPANMDGAQPSLKVIVDTQPPIVSLQSLGTRGSDVGVSWDVRDENIDLSQAEAIRLEYRAGVSANWLPLPVPPGANQYYWNPGAVNQVEVRLRAQDRAGNTAETNTTINLLGAQSTFTPTSPNPERPVAPDPVERPRDILNGPSENERRLVNSLNVSLNFKLEDVGPSGVRNVDVWYTLDGRGWNKYPVDFVDSGPMKNISFKVAGEGLYGLTLVAHSGVGLGERPPQLGDRPQIWIEVDTTKPVVQLHKVLVGTGAEKNKLQILWSARDKNMGRDPIKLSYAEQSGDSWTTIADKLPNTGKYIWNMPTEKIPYQFHVKVEALDAAGNIGEAVTEDLVKVDLAQPKVKILNVGSSP